MTLVMLTRMTVSQVLLLAPDENQGAPHEFFGTQIAFAGLSMVLVVPLSGGQPAGVVALVAAAAAVTLLQDATRYWSFAVDGGHRAIKSDLTWLLVGICCFIALDLLGYRGLSAVCIAWAVGAAVAVGLVQPEWAMPSFAFIRHRVKDLGFLAGEALIVVGSGYTLTWMIVWVGGYESLGVVRAAQLSMAPMSSLARGLATSSLRGFVRDESVACSMWRFLRLVAVYELGNLVVGLGLVGAWSGSLILGENWGTVRGLLWPVLLGQAISGVTLLLQNLIRARVGTDVVFKLRAFGMAIDVSLVLLGVAHSGGPGAVVGFAAAQMFALMATAGTLILARRALRREWAQ